ncbi:TrkH family potassium uptake protein [Bacillota bacterium LX-D]|nr:TrkH family potassium uptake protein [Bacillota bacterium LX-D]
MKNHLSPWQIIFIGFILIILLGTVLLLLPFAVQPGKQINLVDAFFTAASAMCVTGLVVVDTGSTFSIFGRTVLAVLIQIGGLGFMSLTVFFYLLMRKKISLKDRLLLKESLNLNSLEGLVKLAKFILIFTFTAEGIGALISFFVFQKDFGTLSGLGISVFHAVSAFNNAGFDILANNFNNLIPYRNNVVLNLCTSALIIIGGLGFIVHAEILKKRRWKYFSVHTKIVLLMTVLLIAVGTILLFLSENVTLLGAFFQSVSARTAGFNTYNLDNFTDAGKFVLVLLMFIGASPGSTGGGIKTSTLFILISSIGSYINNSDCVLWKHRITDESIRKSFVIFALALGIVILNTYLITLIEHNIRLIKVLFEVTSALGTVGLSTGITPTLHWSSKLLLVMTMLAGRVGILTIAFAIYAKSRTRLKYPEEDILIG